jgi:CshA-type fibril repeat protein
VCKATFTVAGQGTWSIDRLTGIPQFTADPAAPAGSMTPVTYRVTDIVGQTATAQLTPVLPPPSVPANDTSVNALDVNQTINVIANDTPGQGATFMPTTVKLCGTGQVAPFCSQSTLTVPNEGTYTVNANGSVTFDPLPNFVGTATPVDYQVLDSLGRAYAASITPRVTITPPTANPDTVTLQAGASASFQPIFGSGALANAMSGGPALLTNTTCIVDPANNTCGTTVTIAGEGTYTLNPSTGVVTYAAVANATPGAKTPVQYLITDADGFIARATLTPTLSVPPTTTTTTPAPTTSVPPSPSQSGTTTTVPANSNGSTSSQSNPASNSSTKSPEGVAHAVDRLNWTRPSTPVFFNPSFLATPSTGAKFNTSLTKLYVPAEHRWSIQVKTSDGVWVVIGDNVRFTPADGFLGKAVVTFQIVDTAGKVAHATLTAIVTGTPPTIPATGNNTSSQLAWAFSILLMGLVLVAVRRGAHATNN